MNNTFLATVILFIGAAAILTETAHAQMVFQQKRGQNTVGISAGINYNSGYDLQVTYSKRISNTPFFVTAGYIRSTEELDVSALIDYKENVTSSIVHLKGKYSFYDFISPVPINISLSGGFLLTHEKMDLRDNTTEKNNSFGNILSASVEWYFSRYLSLFVQQNVMFLYSSPFGGIKGSTVGGINFNF